MDPRGDHRRPSLARWRRLHTARASANQIATTLLALMAVPVLLCSGFCIVPEMAAGTPLWELGVALAILALAATGFWAFIRFVIDYERPERISHIDGCLRRGVCPHCAYSLRNLLTEPDACTLCPECGAAWRLPKKPTQSTETNS